MVEGGGDGADSTELVLRKLNALLQGKEVKSDFPGNVRVFESSLELVSPFFCRVNDRANFCLQSSTMSLSDPALLSSVLSSLASSRTQSLRTQLPPISPALHPHLFPLLPLSALTLVIFYTTTTSPSSTGHLLLTLPLGARTNVLKSTLELAEMKAGGIYAESQRERRVLLEGLRASEWGGEDCIGVVGLRVEEVLGFDFGAGCVDLPFEGLYVDADLITR